MKPRRILLLAVPFLAVALLAAGLAPRLIARASGGGPGITHITPGNGAVSTKVLITGSGFTGATSVQFGGASAASRVISDTKIGATVP